MAIPGRGRRACRSRPAPAALYLGRPLVYLLDQKDALLDEEPLRGRDPAFVVREVAVAFEALYGPAVLVRTLEALRAQRRVDGVGEALPFLDLVPPLVYRAAGRPAHI